MGEHLDTLVLAQIQRALLVDTACFACSKSHDLKAHGLLVVLNQLNLIGIQYTGHSGRNHIVYGSAVTVLLNIDRCGRELTGYGRGAVGGAVNGLLVVAPLAGHEFQ